MNVKSKFMSTILYLELDLRTGLKKTEEGRNTTNYES